MIVGVSALVSGILGTWFFVMVVVWVLIAATSLRLRVLRWIEGFRASPSVDLTLNQMYGDVNYQGEQPEPAKHIRIDSSP